MVPKLSENLSLCIHMATAAGPYSLCGTIEPALLKVPITGYWHVPGNAFLFAQSYNLGSLTIVNHSKALTW